MPDLCVPYVSQEKDYYCGPATVQMVLEFLKVAIPDQDSLYLNRCHSSIFDPIDDWLTSPDGIAGTLFDHVPASVSNDFCVVGSDNGNLISRKIASTIQQLGIPVPFLKWGTHWVLVRGFESDVLPAGPDDCSYQIQSFWVNDPAAAASIPVKKVDFEIHVPYDTDWQTSFLGPVNLGKWKRQVVAICNSIELPNCTGPQTPIRRKLSGDMIIPIDAARVQGLNALKQHGLFKRGPWKTTLANTAPGNPILVQRLDRLDDFYYIVPLQNGGGNVPVLACIDARNGDYLQSVRISGPDQHFFPVESFDPRAGLEKILEQPLDLGRKGRVKFRKEAHSLYPSLVWKPCRESLSPYMPFFMFIIGDSRVFIRTDGQIFRKLHPIDRGN